MVYRFVSTAIFGGLFFSVIQASPAVAEPETLTIGAALSSTGQHRINGRHTKKATTSPCR